jgi:hypothetical protein
MCFFPKKHEWDGISWTGLVMWRWFQRLGDLPESEGFVPAVLLPVSSHALMSLNVTEGKSWFLFFFKFFLKIYLFIICKYTVAVFRHSRRGSQILLQMVVSHHVVAGIWTLDLRKSSRVLLHTEPSHQPEIMVSTWGVCDPWILFSAILLNSLLCDPSRSSSPSRLPSSALRQCPGTYLSPTSCRVLAFVFETGSPKAFTSHVHPHSWYVALADKDLERLCWNQSFQECEPICCFETSWEWRSLFSVHSFLSSTVSQTFQKRTCTQTKLNKALPGDLQWVLL